MLSVLVCSATLAAPGSALATTTSTGGQAVPDAPRVTAVRCVATASPLVVMVPVVGTVALCPTSP